MSALTGRSLHQGKYTVEQELGRGGFGITYRAKNNVLAQDVVIKTINDALRQDPQFLKHQSQFQDEARRLAKCFHPNIVRVTDFFIEDGLPYIVMDYIPGQTLDKFVQPGRPLPEARALYYIRQVGEAVEAIHRAGLLHRDIKPQNLILQPETQQVVLIDFGIAREFTPGITQRHTHMVSEGYAPIEQYLPQAPRSQATDVYGLAATLYTLLTAQVPVAASLRDRAPLPPPHQVQPTVSPAVSAAVMKGMAVEPHERPQRVRDWLASLPAIANTPGMPTPPSQVATVVAAPRYRPTTPVNPGAATAPVRHPGAAPQTEVLAPSQSSDRTGFSWWLPTAVLLSIVLPFGLGYGLWRNQTSTPTPTVSPTATPTPSETPAVTEQNRPEPTNREPIQPIEQESNPEPTPEAQPEPEPTTPPEAATPAASEPASSQPVEPAPPDAPSVETPIEPAPPPLVQPNQSAPSPEAGGSAPQGEARQEGQAGSEAQPGTEGREDIKPEKKPDKKEKNRE